ncbi:MAG: hypothetical protein KFKLKKLM_01661 [Flavobacteriales bacterium]|nr:hypothetical protein [Flavobacteriales bacterium]
MKKILFFLTFSFIILNVNSQNCEQLTFNTDSLFNDTIKFSEYDTHILECANCILSKPLNNISNNRMNCMIHIIKYMGNNHHVEFIDVYPRKILMGNSKKMVVFMATIVKNHIETKENPLSEKDFFIKVLAEFIQYCENPEKKVTRFNREMKKVVALKNSGELSKYYEELLLKNKPHQKLE